MAGVTYSIDPMKCYQCNYLLTVERIEPENGESKVKIFCGIKGCPFSKNTQSSLNNRQKEIARQKIEQCIEMLKKCIENKSQEKKVQL